MKKILILMVLLSLVAVQAEASSLEIELNDNSVQAGFSMPLRSDDYGTSLLNARFLYNNHKDTTLGSAGFDFMGTPGNVPGLDLGVGAQVYGGQAASSQSLLSVGVGGRVAFAPPMLQGAGISAKFFYAPHILSLLDVDRMLETGVRVSYAVTPKVKVYVGYQYIRADFDQGGSGGIDDSVRVGFNASF
jgi:opacity protein-like surface antigen